MELKALKDEDKKLMIEMKGETVAFAHMLKDELWKDTSTSEAAAIKDHPYLSEARLFLAVSKGSPKTVLEKAGERIAEHAKELKEKFKDSLKK